MSAKSDPDAFPPEFVVPFVVRVANPEFLGFNDRLWDFRRRQRVMTIQEKFQMSREIFRWDKFPLNFDLTMLWLLGLLRCTCETMSVQQPHIVGGALAVSGTQDISRLRCRLSIQSEQMVSESIPVLE